MPDGKIRNRMRENSDIIRHSLIYILFISPLLFFFYDTFNFNANILSASTLFIGLNSYQHGSLVVASFMINPYNLLYLFFYTITNYSVMYSAILVKVVSLLFTLGSSLLVYRIVLRHNPRFSKVALLSFLFSPFIIFVNYVWLQPEIISIFFLLLALYLFNKNSFESSSWLNFSIVSLSLVIASFTFYFPVFLIPSFLFYSRSVRSSLKLLATTILVGFPVLFLMMFYDFSSTFTRVIVGAAPAVYPYSIFTLFDLQPTTLQFLQHIFLTFFILTSGLVPLILSRKRLPIELSLLIIIMEIIILQFTGLNADSFVFAIPFMIICYVSLKSLKPSLIGAFLLQIFLLPDFLIAELIDGPGHVSGVFYWIYPYFPNQIDLSNYIARLHILIEILATVSVVMLIGICSYLLFANSSTRYEHQNIKEREKNFGEKAMVGDLPTSARKRSVLSVLMVLLIVSSTVLGAMLLSGVPNDNRISGQSNFPYMMFIPNQTSSGNYVMQYPGSYQYFSSNDTLHYYTNSSAVGFYRDISGTDFNFGANVSVGNLHNNLGNFQRILVAGNISVGESIPVHINRSTNVLNWTTSHNVTTLTNVSQYSVNNPGFISDAPVNIFNFLSTSLVNYDFNYSNFVGKTIFAAARIASFANSQNVLWHMQLAGRSYESFLAGNYFYTGCKLGVNWSFHQVYLPISLDQWFLYGITFQVNGTFSSFVNGINELITIPPLSSSTSGVITTGTFEGPNEESFSFSGNQTNLYFARNTSRVSSEIYYLYSGKNLLFSYITDSSKPQFGLSLSSHYGGDYNVSIGKLSRNEKGNLNSIVFGKLNLNKASVSFSNIKLEYYKSSSEVNYFILVLIVGILYPLLLYFAWALVDGELIRKSQNGNLLNPKKV